MTSVLSVVGKYTIKTAIVVLPRAVFYKVLRESTKISPLFQPFLHILASVSSPACTPSSSLLGEDGGNVLLTNYGDLDASININTIKNQGLYGISTNPGSPTQFAKMLVIERAGRIRQFVMATIASVAVYSRCFANNEWGAWYEVSWNEVS